MNNYTCIPLKNVAGENNRFLIARMRESERKRERGRERGRRDGARDALGLTIFNTHYLLFCVNTEAIAGEGEKEDKRQHKYDALQK